jgi:hypothetical protein
LASEFALKTWMLLSWRNRATKQMIMKTPSRRIRFSIYHPPPVTIDRKSVTFLDEKPILTVRRAWTPGYP